MAEYRTIHTKMWRDSWYSELDVEGKLLWVYLITNQAASLTGIYHLPIRYAAFETGLGPERVETLLAQFVLSGKIEYENEIVWIHKMRKYQAQNESSPKIKPRIEKDLAEIPDCKIKRMYIEQYSIDTISIPSHTEQEQEQDTETEHDTESFGAPAPRKPDPKSELRFDSTPQGALMAQKLRVVFESKGRRVPETYANASQRDAFLRVYSALGDKLESLLGTAMERDISDRARLLSWLQGCVKKNGNGQHADSPSVIERAILISRKHDEERKRAADGNR